MKKTLLFLVLLQMTLILSAGQPVLKSEMCGKVSNEQFITALDKGDPDGIFNLPVETIKAEYKKVLNWAIEYYAWGFDPITTDAELFAAMRVCSVEPVVFSEGSRLVSYAESGGMKYSDFRANYSDEKAGTFNGKPLWSDWCKNLLPEKEFLNHKPSTGVVKKETVTANAGQPINIYIVAGNNNGNGNGGNATALAVQPAADNAVDASAPAPVVYQPPAPRYEPPTPVVYQQPPVVYTTGPTHQTDDCPECKKASPWGYVLAAGAGVAAGYLINQWIGGGSSSGGTYYGGPTGGPVDINGGNPIGPGGPVDITGGPVDVGGGFPD